MTLQEYIEDLRRQRNERRAADDAKRDEDEARYEELLNTVMANLRQRARDAIPEPLRPFITYAGPQPDEATLLLYPEGWMPTDFRIKLPGLAPIAVAMSAEGETLQVETLTVGRVSFSNDWVEAVGTAEDLGESAAAGGQGSRAREAA